MGSGGRASQSVERPSGRPPFGSGLLPGSPRPSSPRERHGSARGRAETGSTSGGRHRALLAPAELRVVGPHAVQDAHVLDKVAYAAPGLAFLVPRDTLRR